LHNYFVLFPQTLTHILHNGNKNLSTTASELYCAATSAQYFLLFFLKGRTNIPIKQNQSVPCTPLSNQECRCLHFTETSSLPIAFPPPVLHQGLGKRVVSISNFQSRPALFFICIVFQFNSSALLVEATRKGAHLLSHSNRRLIWQTQ